jgi:hypothetical protein
MTILMFELLQLWGGSVMIIMTNNICGYVNIAGILSSSGLRYNQKSLKAPTLITYCSAIKYAHCYALYILFLY